MKILIGFLVVFSLVLGGVLMYAVYNSYTKSATATLSTASLDKNYRAPPDSVKLTITRDSTDYHVIMTDKAAPEVAKPPSIEAYSKIYGDIYGRDAEGARLYMALMVKNPNSIPVVFDNGRFLVYINNTYISRGNFPGTAIEGYSTKRVNTSIPILLDSEWREKRNVSLEDLTGAASVSVKVYAFAYIPFGYGVQKISRSDYLAYEGNVEVKIE